MEFISKEAIYILNKVEKLKEEIEAKDKDFKNEIQLLEIAKIAIAKIITDNAYKKED